jgi:hypothetical protein
MAHITIIGEHTSQLNGDGLLFPIITLNDSKASKTHTRYNHVVFIERNSQARPTVDSLPLSTLAGIEFGHLVLRYRYILVPISTRSYW